MEYLKIAHWDRWQSYRKDRPKWKPDWIKLHKALTTNPEWISLTDAQRGQLVSMWMLAADHEGSVPSSPTLVRHLCHLKSLPNLELFIDLGFIENGEPD